MGLPFCKLHTTQQLKRRMKTLWIFSALVLAALFNESHQIQNILVVTGSTEDGTRHPLSGNKYKIVSQKVEIWSQQKTQCVVPDYPVAVSSAVGFWTAQGPTVCGGSSYTIYHLEESPCYFFNNKQHQWMPWTPLKKKRSPTWNEGPKLPRKLYSHTMVETN